MDKAIEQFLTAGTAVLVLSVIILTFFTRRVLETAVPSLKKKADENEAGVTYSTSLARWYQQVILYAIPVFFGALIGFFNVPYLFDAGEGLETTASRVFFGGVAGWLSSFVYKVFRQAVKKKTGVDLPSASVPPQAAPPPGEED